MSKSNKLAVQKVTVCAVMVALGTVLSWVKVFSFPTGGSITMFSMLVVCLPAYWYGLRTGITTGLVYGLLQLMFGGYVMTPVQVICDYILAFGALGLAGIFANKKYGIIYGFLVGITGRFIFSVISGVAFFAEYAWEGWNPWAYSIVYNGIYIYAEGIVTLVILLISPVRNTIEVTLKNLLNKNN